MTLTKKKNKLVKKKNEGNFPSYINDFKIITFYNSPISASLLTILLIKLFTYNLLKHSYCIKKATKLYI